MIVSSFALLDQGGARVHRDDSSLVWMLCRVEEYEGNEQVESRGDYAAGSTAKLRRVCLPLGGKRY